MQNLIKSNLHSLNLFHLSLLLSGLFWGVLLFRWIGYDPAAHIDERIPGMDGEPTGNTAVEATTVQGGEQKNSTIGEFFAAYQGVPSEIESAWPRFRGEEFDNISKESFALQDFSTDTTARILWSMELGEGHAAPVVYNGRVYVLDYDEEENADALRCLSLDDGREIWRRWYTVKVKRNHGMSRTAPAVTDSFMVTIGPRCHVMAVHPATGDLLWGIDLEKEYGTEVPLWYTGQNPLIDDSVAVIAPGGKSLLIGVHGKTGDILWETPNKNQWKMSHSSVMPMEFGGRSIYLYCASGGIVGVAADGDDRGAILFETNEFNQSVVAPSPVIMDDGRIFMTAGYGGGSSLLQLSQEDGAFSITQLQRIDVKDGMASEQQTPLYYRGHLFSVLPKDGGIHKDQLVCVNEKDPTRYIWASGPENRFGLGPYLIADDKLYILDDYGRLTVAKASTEKFEKLGSVNLMDGIDAWGPMALVAGRLLVRDSKRMLCVDLRAR